MKDREPAKRVLYPESITTNPGFQRRATEDVFGRRPADPLEIQDMIDLARINTPRAPKLPKGQRKKSA